MRNVNLFDTVRCTPHKCNAIIIGYFGRMYVLAVGDLVNEDYILADAVDIGVVV
ncbi:MAG: hypothetical protein KAS32_14560 [Candidatus Peribacteraceae bacterium]|nr:hypothetical protein [Candidatus Peribacteraceae bacterium]